MERNIYKIGKELFITSNEEIKEGDCFLPQGHINPHKLKEYNKINGDLESYNGLCYDISKCKKIILTTDVDLIKDGVQDIDDEFLEWLVDNPSCEEVEVKTRYVHYYKTGETFISLSKTPEFSSRNMQCIKIEPRYEIIIPKEEPKQEQKQHLIDMMRGDEELGLYEEPKQETTLEEIEIISKKRIHKYRPMNPHPMSFSIGFKAGAEWEAKRRYSEEEVVSILYEQLESLDYYGEDFSFSLFWEQFKKK